MTEPKKEKCEACCGSGYINFWTDDGHISMRTCRRCDGYGYIKAKPMTNEEWFCSLSTEEKVTTLLDLRERIRQKMRGEIGSENKFYKGDYYREWLKEIHE